MGVQDAFDPLGVFFSVCPEMLFILAPDGAIRRLSAPLQDLLGGEAGEGALLSRYIHPDDLRAFEAGWAALTASEAPVRFPCRVLGADGAPQALELSARRAPASGEIHGALRPSGAARSQEERELEREGKLLRVFLANISMIAWAIDRQGVFTHHKGKGIAAAGLQEGKFVGLNVFDLYADSEEGMSTVRRALAGEQLHTFLESNGVSWEHWYVPLRDEQGAVTGLAGLTLDLSEARKAEKDLRVQLALVERQQQVIRSLSTPIIEVWDKVLTLPMLGVVDSVRAAEVMEKLLGQVSRKGARFAILDLTGVETVDTGTAGHLIKLIQALRLLGAEGIITGIQPNVAQTMVALGMELTSIVTLSNLRDGLRLCMKRLGQAPR